MTARTPLRPEALAAALERIEHTLVDWPVLEAVIARREAGIPDPQAPRRAAALAAALCRLMSPDGSWGSDVFRTAENLLLLREIAPAPDTHVRGVAAAACAWLLARQDQPGRFGEGCDPASHEAGLCEHHVSGFFSAGEPTHDLAARTLAAGGRFQTDAGARFAASCLALRALITWDTDRERVEDGLRSLRVILMRHVPGAEPVGCCGYASGVAAVGSVPYGEPDRVSALAGLARLAATQRGDGSWPGVDLFHVLEVLTSPALLRHRLDAAEAAIQRAAGMLSLMLGPDGSWGRESGPVRTLIGWRTLRRALRRTSA